MDVGFRLAKCRWMDASVALYGRFPDICESLDRLHSLSLRKSRGMDAPTKRMNR